MVFHALNRDAGQRTLELAGADGEETKSGIDPPPSRWRVRNGWQVTTKTLGSNFLLESTRSGGATPSFDA